MIDLLLLIIDLSYYLLVMLNAGGSILAFYSDIFYILSFDFIHLTFDFNINSLSFLFVGLLII